MHQNEVQFLKIAFRYPKQLAVRYVIQHELTNKHTLTCTRVIPPHSATMNRNNVNHLDKAANDRLLARIREVAITPNTTTAATAA